MRRDVGREFNQASFMFYVRTPKPESVPATTPEHLDKLIQHVAPQFATVAVAIVFPSEETLDETSVSSHPEPTEHPETSKKMQVIRISENGSLIEHRELPEPYAASAMRSLVLALIKVSSRRQTSASEVGDVSASAHCDRALADSSPTQQSRRSNSCTLLCTPATAHGRLDRLGKSAHRFLRLGMTPSGVQCQLGSGVE